LNNNSINYCLLWIFILALVLFLGNIVESDLRFDNIFYAALSKSVLYSDNFFKINLVGSPYFNKPPLFFWINSIPIFILGNSVLAAKIVSIIFGIANLPLIYLFAKKLTKNVNIANLSVFVFLTTVTIVKNTRACRMESMLVFFILFSLFFLVKYSENQKPYYLFYWGTLSGFAVLTKGIAGFIPIIVGLFYLIILVRRNDIKISFSHVFFALMCFLFVFLWWFIYMSFDTEFMNRFFKKEIVIRIFETFKEGKNTMYEKKPFYSYFKYLITKYFYYLPFCILGFLKLKKELQNNEIFKLITFYVFIVFILIHFISSKYERYLYLIFPFLSIWTAIGLISYFKKVDFNSFIKKFTIVALIVTAIIPINQSSQQYSVLKNVKKLADKNNCPIIVEKTFFNYWENKAAIYYFLDDYFLEPIPNKNKYIFISKPNNEGLNNILVLNKKMKIVFKEK
jgi:4-amino-4-deoxy-L-arabinose transferase-like glycosyltransferase